MNQERHRHEIARVVLLERMAASRAALLEANQRAAAPVPRSAARSSVGSIAASLADAPHVALVLALVAGAIVLGPRRTLSLASRTGAAAWINRNIRRLAAH